MNQENNFVELIKTSLLGTLVDVLPIVIVLVVFQVLVLRKKFPQSTKVFTGFVLVIFGLGIFIVGLEQCIFPLGTQMAGQLTDPAFLAVGGIENPDAIDFKIYIWTYIFAFFIGFSTTLAEPALIAVAIKAREISTGAISAGGLRIAVALGVAIGVTLGTYRIISGTPLYIYIAVGYGFLLLQTYIAPRMIVPLAFDSGGVTTSTVTVPLLAALGIGLASHVPGRSPLLDGFGLIAFAALFPIITVMAYAMITERLTKRSDNNADSPLEEK